MGNNNTGFYGYSSESKMNSNAINRNVPKNRMPSSGKFKVSKILGIILCLLQLAASVAFVYYVKTVDFLDEKYFYGLIGILSGLFILTYVMAHPKKMFVRRLGKFISIVVIIVLAVGSYMIWKSPLTVTGKKVSNKPFVVYLSAADTFGKFDKKTLSRTDTNIIAVVNPKTYTILMVSTPRDYYVPIEAKSVAPNSMEKLTHVSLFGSGVAYSQDKDPLSAAEWSIGGQQGVYWHPGNQAIMATLKKLYNIKVKNKDYYYAKVNFTGFESLVDELGGVNVKVEDNFSTKTYATYKKVSPERKEYVYKKGTMKMDGSTALTFARERHSFGDGDMARNRNQIRVMKAIADKMISGKTLVNYNGVIDAINNCYATDIDLSSMAKLQTQISTKSDYKGWKFMSFSVIGVPGKDKSTYTGNIHAVVYQNQDSVANASKLIAKALAAKTQDDAKKLNKLVKKYTKAQAGQ